MDRGGSMRRDYVDCNLIIISTHTHTHTRTLIKHMQRGEGSEGRAQKQSCAQIAILLSLAFGLGGIALARGSDDPLMTPARHAVHPSTCRRTPLIAKGGGVADSASASSRWLEACLQTHPRMCANPLCSPTRHTSPPVAPSKCPWRCGSPDGLAPEGAEGKPEWDAAIERGAGSADQLAAEFVKVA